MSNIVKLGKTKSYAIAAFYAIGTIFHLWLRPPGLGLRKDDSESPSCRRCPRTGSRTTHDCGFSIEKCDRPEPEGLRSWAKIGKEPRQRVCRVGATHLPAWGCGGLHPPYTRSRHHSWPMSRKACPTFIPVRKSAWSVIPRGDAFILGGAFRKTRINATVSAGAGRVPLAAAEPLSESEGDPIGSRTLAGFPRSWISSNGHLEDINHEAVATDRGLAGVVWP